MNSKIYLIFLLNFTLVFGSAAQTPVERHGKLQVKGTALTDANGKPVRLCGVSYGWHNLWPRFYNRPSVKWLADDWNCNIVRAAIGIDLPKGYREDPQGAKEKLNEVVQGALENGIYVIIDWHSHRYHTEEAIAFFQEAAKKYGEYPNVIYEIFNEPERTTWDSVKMYSEKVIAAIREIDPDNIILVGSPHWDQDVHLAADNPIKGYSNLMYTLHFYAVTHKEELRRRGDYALKKGLPLFVSESAGMEATGDGPIDDKEWTKWRQWMEKHNLSWITWSVSDKDETCSMLTPEASSEGNWQTNVLKESGKKTRKFLREL